MSKKKEEHRGSELQIAAIDSKTFRRRSKHQGCSGETGQGRAPPQHLCLHNMERLVSCVT